MSDENGTQTPKKPSWQEREVTLALQRLVRARANLAGLEEQAAGPTSVLTAADPADLAKADEIEDELTKLRPKAAGRFGGGGARERIEELEFQRRLVFERIGVADYAQITAARAVPDDAGPSVDADVLAFARRECEQAEQAFLEVAALVIPDADPDDEQFGEGADQDEGEDAEIINLNVKPHAS